MFMDACRSIWVSCECLWVVCPSTARLLPSSVRRHLSLANSSPPQDSLSSSSPALSLQKTVQIQLLWQPSVNSSQYHQYHARRNKFERFRPFCVFHSSNSNRILSSRELIILSDSNFWCVWGSCAVCCGLFSHEDRHTAGTQHSTDIHSTVKL